MSRNGFVMANVGGLNYSILSILSILLSSQSSSLAYAERSGYLRASDFVAGAYVVLSIFHSIAGIKPFASRVATPIASSSKINWFVSRSL